MKLQEFIEKNIEPNAVVRLVTNIPGGHMTVEKNWDKVYMEHEIKNTEYKNWQALFVTNIRGTGKEVINIVVIDPNPYRNFINNIKADEDMFRSYKDNIAMAFKDTFDPNKTLHENANIGAQHFLDNLTR